MSMDVSTGYYIPKSNAYANSQTIDRAGGVSDAVGAGAVAGASDAPDVVPGLSYGVLMASLGPIMPRMSGEQLDVLVASFTEKAKDVSDASDKDQIKTQSAAKSAALKEKKANADNAIKKQEEAKEKLEHASTWDKFKLAFQYVGALLTIAAGIATFMVAALTAETGVGLVAGIAAGSLMVASGYCMLTMAVDSTVQMAQQDQGKGDLGMFGMMCKNIAKSRGMSDEDAEAVGQKGAMGASIALGAMSAAFGLASAAAGGAESVVSLVETGINIGKTVASEAEEGASLASKAVDFVELAAQTAKEAIKDTVTKAPGKALDTAKSAMADSKIAGQMAAKLGSEAVDLASDGSNIGAAATDIGSGVEHYQAQGLQADAQHAQANTKRFQAVQQAFDDAIDLALSHLKARGEAFDQVIDGVMDAMNDRSQTLSNMQFRA